MLQIQKTIADFGRTLAAVSLLALLALAVQTLPAHALSIHTLPVDLFPDRAAAALPDASLPGIGVLDSAGPAIFAMGGRDEAALSPRGGGDESVPEQIFGGSYLGALFFGYPATGFGGADLIALAVLAYLVLRAAGGRKIRDRDRFTVHRGGLDRDADDSGANASGKPTGIDLGQRDVPRERNDASLSGNPRDNAWSRKIKGGSGDGTGGGTGNEREGGKENPWGLGGRNGNPWNRQGNREDNRPHSEPGNRRGNPSGSLPGPASGKEQPQRPRVTVRDRAEAMWGHLAADRSGQPDRTGRQEAAVAAGARVPAGFDVNDFLDGARTLYVRLQNAWADRKVDDLAPFVSGELMAMLRGQAEANPEPSPVDIVLVNATLQDVRGDSGDQRASVHFNVLMKNAGEAQNAEVNELWTFARSTASGGMWRLTGIEAA